MRQERLATALVLGAILLVPSAARACGLLVAKVDKATVRASSSQEHPPLVMDAPPAPSSLEIPVVRETNPELTKPGAIRIFLISTPHNHRAPPAA